MTGYILLAALVLLQVADVKTTNDVISRGGRELNPVVKAFMKIFGKAWEWVKSAVVIALGVFLLYLQTTISLVVLAGLVLLYAWVVWHNYNQ